MYIVHYIPNTQSLVYVILLVIFIWYYHPVYYIVRYTYMCAYKICSHYLNRKRSTFIIHMVVRYMLTHYINSYIHGEMKIDDILTFWKLILYNTKKTSFLWRDIMLDTMYIKCTFLCVLCSSICHKHLNKNVIDSVQVTFWVLSLRDNHLCGETEW